MIKFTAVFNVIILMILIALAFINSKYLSLVIILAVILMLVVSYFYFERSSMGTKEITLIATLSAVAGASRVPFAALPGIQPTTFLVALSGYVFGAFPGFIIGSTSAFISNIFLGQGPYTPWQMLAWGIVGCISGGLGLRAKTTKQKMSVEKFAVICFLYGFLFNWIMNLWHVIGFVRPLTLRTIALAYLWGLTFDIMHAVGNFILAVIFYEKLSKILFRFKRKLEITYIDNI
jgi:energy-coupling factor transport system substrate-specific component